MFPKKMTPASLWAREESSSISSSAAVAPDASIFVADKLEESPNFGGIEGVAVGAGQLWPNSEVKCKVLSEEASPNNGIITIEMSGIASTAASVITLSEEVDAESYISVGVKSVIDIKWAVSKSGVRIAYVIEKSREYGATFSDGNGNIREQDKKMTQSAIGADLSWSKGESSLLSWWDDEIATICLICLFDGRDPIAVTAGCSKPAKLSLKGVM